MVYDGSPRAIRQRTVNFAAKRFADMMYVTGLDRGTAERHFRWRAAGDSRRPDRAARRIRRPGELIAAHRAGRLTIETNDADRRATVQWSDPAFGAPLTGSAIARPGYGGILLGSRTAPSFDPAPIARRSDPGARLATRRCRRAAGAAAGRSLPRRSMRCSPTRQASTAF